MMGHQSGPVGPVTLANMLTRRRALDFLDKMWNVVLLNDDETTFEFVIQLLMTQFNKKQREAEAITNKIHQTGRGVAGTYPIELAETKAHDSTEMARAAGFPLKVVIEPFN